MKLDLQSILKLPAVQAAPLLLGFEIVRRTAGQQMRVRIVETEAYHQDDPASHSYRGRTKRTEPMFMSGGRLYVYFTYGMHYCINVVTGPANRGEAVLIRAAEPLEGLVTMRLNRGEGKSDISLTNGPAKLAQALAIHDTAMSGKLLSLKTLQIIPPGKKEVIHETVVTTRIGIRKSIEANLRFYIKDNPYISKQ